LNNLDIAWEVVYVDDGSADASLSVLEETAENDTEHTCVVALRRNFGQTAAIAAGIDHADGDVIILMDADLQNDPADIPRMLEKIEEGYDVVSGWRKNRQDTFITRTLPSRIANWLISVVTGVYLHDYGCTLKAYRRSADRLSPVWRDAPLYPAYAHTVGAKMIELRQPPSAGLARPSMELNRTIKVILDLITVKFLISYANKPIYLFGVPGRSSWLSAQACCHSCLFASCCFARVWCSRHFSK
jgi:glycosyltransferase involved in cell wall biosynthesis